MPDDNTEHPRMWRPAQLRLVPPAPTPWEQFEALHQAQITPGTYHHDGPHQTPIPPTAQAEISSILRELRTLHDRIRTDGRLSRAAQPSVEELINQRLMLHQDVLADLAMDVLPATSAAQVAPGVVDAIVQQAWLVAALQRLSTGAITPLEERIVPGALDDDDSYTSTDTATSIGNRTGSGKSDQATGDGGNACFCNEIGPLLTAPRTSGRAWQCDHCTRVWSPPSPSTFSSDEPETPVPASPEAANNP